MADSPLAARFNAQGFEVEVIQGWDRGPAALWRMRRYLKQTSPEVVHFTDAAGDDLWRDGRLRVGRTGPRLFVSRRQHVVFSGHLRGCSAT